MQPARANNGVWFVGEKEEQKIGGNKFGMMGELCTSLQMTQKIISLKCLTKDFWTLFSSQLNSLGQGVQQDWSCASEAKSGERPLSPLLVLSLAC